MILLIIFSNKDETYIIIMKNMCELPNSSRIFTFDLKGSTVNREVLKKSKVDVFIHGSEDLKYKLLSEISKEVLKDKDLINLEIKIKLPKKDLSLLSDMAKSDSEFLCNNYVTDYSLFVTIHNYSKEEYESKSYSYRVMVSEDMKFIYCFSIIDFLGVRIYIY